MKTWTNNLCCVTTDSYSGIFSERLPKHDQNNTAGIFPPESIWYKRNREPNSEQHQGTGHWRQWHIAVGGAGAGGQCRGFTS